MGITGTVQTNNPIAPGATSTNSTSTDSIYVKGGLKSVTTLAERNYIPTHLFNRATVGMVVYVIDEAKYYQLTGLTNGQNTDPFIPGTGDWKEVISNAESQAAAAARLATSSLTGVASFNAQDFVIGNTGHVTLSSVFTRGSTFNGDVSVGGGLTAQNLFVSQGTTLNTISATTYRGLPAASADGVSGVASFRASDFTVSATGNVRLAANLVRTLNGLTGDIQIQPDPDKPYFTVTPTSAGKITLNPLNLAKTDAVNTFYERQTFTVGITTGQLYVGGGATFASGIQGLNSALSVNNNRITNLAAPSAASDAATRAYVDNVAAGLNYHPNVHVATVTALPASTYFNVDTPPGGSGAYLEGNVNGNIGLVDGLTMFGGDRILVKNESSLTHNGIYFVSLTGDASTKWKLIRAKDSDNSIPGQVAGGDTVYVEAGITNGGAGFVLIGTSSVGLTLGESPIVWTQYTGVDTTVAGDGLGKSGNSLNVLVDNSTIEIASDQLRLKNSSNYALKDTANTFTQIQTFSGGITTQSLYVSQGATFASLARFDAGLTTQNLFVSQGVTFNSLANFAAGLTAQNLFVSQGASITGGGLTAYDLVVVRGATFNSLANFAAGLTAQNLFVSQGASITGGGLTAYDLVVVRGATFNTRANFAAGLTTQNLFVSQGASITGGGLTAYDLVVVRGATFNSLANFAAGLTAQNLFVSQGATFNSLARFVSGLSSEGTVTVQALSVNTGATFNNRANFAAGLTTQNLFVSQGATFDSLALFIAGLSTSNIWASGGVTFSGIVDVLGTMNIQNLYVPGGATFDTRVSFVAGLSAGGWTRLRELGVARGATFARSVFVNRNLAVREDIFGLKDVYAGIIPGGGLSGDRVSRPAGAPSTVRDGNVIRLPTGQLIKTFYTVAKGDTEVAHASGLVNIEQYTDEDYRNPINIGITCGYADIVVTAEGGTAGDGSLNRQGFYSCRFNVSQMSSGQPPIWNQYSVLSEGEPICSFDIRENNDNPENGLWNLFVTPIGRTEQRPLIVRSYAILTPTNVSYDDLSSLPGPSGGGIYFGPDAGISFGCLWKTHGTETRPEALCNPSYSP